ERGAVPAQTLLLGRRRWGALAQAEWRHQTKRAESRPSAPVLLVWSVDLGAYRNIIVVFEQFDEDENAGGGDAQSDRDGDEPAIVSTQFAFLSNRGRKTFGGGNRRGDHRGEGGST